MVGIGEASVRLVVGPEALLGGDVDDFYGCSEVDAIVVFAGIIMEGEVVDPEMEYLVGL